MRDAVSRAGSGGGTICRPTARKYSVTLINLHTPALWQLAWGTDFGVAQDAKGLGRIRTRLDARRRPRGVVKDFTLLTLKSERVALNVMNVTIARTCLTTTLARGISAS